MGSGRERERERAFVASEMFAFRNESGGEGMSGGSESKGEQTCQVVALEILT